MMHGQLFFALVNPIIALIFSVAFALIWLRWPEYRHLPALTLAFPAWASASSCTTSGFWSGQAR
jgi:ABC-type thiamin/hydroxymethylpyrimidine transport system permease subunit